MDDGADTGQIASLGPFYRNTFRNSDSAIGFYDEPDPIGLAGGSYLTYSYANGDPLSNMDPPG